ncbi:TOM1-like protein 4 [Tanacetum coccineum]
MSLGNLVPPWHQFLDQKIRGAHFSLGIVAGERFVIELTPSMFPQRHVAGDRFPQRHVAGEGVRMLLGKGLITHSEPITEEQLKQTRDEFWDTAPHYGGRKEQLKQMRDEFWDTAPHYGGRKMSFKLKKEDSLCKGQWERGTRKKKVEYDVLLLEKAGSKSGNVNYFVPVFGLASTADLTRVNQYVVSLYIYVGIMATINAKKGRRGVGKKVCNRHVAREEAQEREWQRKMNKINSIIRSLILHIPSDSSNTYGGGDAPDRPEEAGQLQFLEEIRTDALKLNFMSMSGRKLNDYETISEAGLSDGSFILWTSHTRFKLDIINHRDGEIFHQFVSITDTIGDLRREIDVSTGMPPRTQMIYVFGVLVEDSNLSLAECGLCHHGSFVDVFYEYPRDHKFEESTDLIIRTGRGDVYRFSVGIQDVDVMTLKAAIQQIGEVSAHNMAILLVYNGLPLVHEHRSLASYYINKHSVVSLVDPSVKEGMMLIDVNLLATGDDEILECEMDRSNTVGDLKSVIQQQRGIPKRCQTLFLPMRQLEGDDLTLADYNIDNGSTIYVDFALMRLYIQFDNGATEEIWITPNERVENSAGVEFPPRVENSVPLFTPPQTHPLFQPISAYQESAIQACLQTDASGLSMSEIVNAEGTVDVLMDMLSALDPNNKTAVKEELIIDLVSQCRSYQNRVATLINSTSDEVLLSKGLALNDTLMRVLGPHDDIATGVPNELGAWDNSVAPLVNATYEDDESEDNFAQLAPRSSRDTLHARNNYDKGESVLVSPLASHPPSSTNPIHANSSSTVDYLSGEVYNSNTKTDSSTPSIAKTARVRFSDQPTYEEPHSANNQQTQVTLSAPLYSSSGSSYDGLVDQTRDLSLASAKKEKPAEDLLFQDLVDFAKSKPTTSKPNYRSSRDSLHAHNKNSPHELVHVIPTPPRPPLATNSKCEDSSRVDEDFWNYIGSSSNGLDGETRDLSLPPVKKEKAEDICN